MGSDKPRTTRKKKDSAGASVAKKKRSTKKSPDRLKGGKLRAADPFELIRWLARSQPDPRKAVAELVQNSLDAGASTVHLTRRRSRKLTELVLRDDGHGVIPDMSREEALRYIATHIGHSRKRDLSPQQRRELMLQGQYGIGLLGFWSIGRCLEIRTRVAGEPALLLRMYEDSPDFEIERVRGKLELEESFTEVIVRDLHDWAMSNLSARKASDYLGEELRGQLLAHDTEVFVHDLIARGRAPKKVRVIPKRFDGERLELPSTIAVHGAAPVSVELYLVGDGRDGSEGVALAQAGTVVFENICSFDIADFNAAPWNTGRIVGVLDFPDFRVPPGSRRSVMPDERATAFVEAVRELEPAILDLLAEADARASAEVEQSVVRRLARAFREVPLETADYDFFRVVEQRSRPIAPSPDSAAGGPAGDGESDEPTEATAKGVSVPDAPAPGTGGDAAEESMLPMAGPLAELVIRPQRARVERLGMRRLRAEGRDESGLRIREGVVVEWGGEGASHELQPQGDVAVELVAGPDTGTVTLTATGRQGDDTATATVEVEVVENDAGSAPSSHGVPDPVFVDDPGAAWRSRMVGERWEVNSAHPDFRRSEGHTKRRLRYLASLLAKEVVLHSFPTPNGEPILERMVQVLTITEKRLEKG